MHGNAHSIRYRMVHPDELRRHAPEAHSLSRLHGYQLCLLKDPVLLELPLDKPESQPCAVNRHIELFQEIGQSPDMILMPVGYRHTAQLVAVLLDVSKIRDNYVNAQHLAVRECKSAVDDEHVIGAFDNGEILAYLVESPERDYLHRGPAAAVLHLPALLRMSLGLLTLFRGHCSALDGQRSGPHLLSVTSRQLRQENVLLFAGLSRLLRAFLTAALRLSAACAVLLNVFR